MYFYQYEEVIRSLAESVCWTRNLYQRHVKKNYYFSWNKLLKAEMDHGLKSLCTKYKLGYLKYLERNGLNICGLILPVVGALFSFVYWTLSAIWFGVRRPNVHMSKSLICPTLDLLDKTWVTMGQKLDRNVIKNSITDIK